MQHTVPIGSVTEYLSGIMVMQAKILVELFKDLVDNVHEKNLLTDLPWLSQNSYEEHMTDGEVMCCCTTIYILNSGADNILLHSVLTFPNRNRFCLHCIGLPCTELMKEMKES